MSRHPEAPRKDAGERRTTRLRKLLGSGKTLFIPGCYDALSARILERVGFPAVYMTGYGTSLALLGMPDAGLATMSEMHLNARYITNAVKLPVIADADDGYGSAINVIRTVKEYIQTGVAGIHIEDQVAPKRCSSVAGRQVIPIDEAVGKFRAADSARKEVDPDFLIIARSDARSARGGSLDDAIRRVNAYLMAGADMAFVEGPTSFDEVKRICREVKGPVLYNQAGASPRLSLAEMNSLGIAITIVSAATLRVTMQAVYDFALQLYVDRPAVEARFFEQFKKHPLGDMHKFAGLDDIRALEEAYLPAPPLNTRDDTTSHQTVRRRKAKHQSRGGDRR